MGLDLPNDTENQMDKGMENDREIGGSWGCVCVLYSIYPPVSAAKSWQKKVSPGTRFPRLGQLGHLRLGLRFSV